jgi:hypothetical protein
MKENKGHRSKSKSSQQRKRRKTHEKSKQKLHISFAAIICKHLPILCCGGLKAGIEQENTESRVEKEQSPYLGRPSSGAPDLEGKQEHSQQ